MRHDMNSCMQVLCIIGIFIVCAATAPAVENSTGRGMFTNVSALSYAPTVDVATDRSTYSIGDAVVVAVQVSEEATVAAYIVTPYGTTYTIDFGTISYGSWHSVPATGLTSTTGTYTIQAKAYFTSWGTTETASTYFYVQGPPFDFKISISPASNAVEQGGAATFQLSAEFSDPYYSGTVISIDQVTGLGAGMSWRRTGNVLSISTTENTPVGTYTVVVTGSAGGLIRQASATLTVAPSFDFSVSISPTTQTVTIGDKTSYTVNVNLVSGTPASVSLSISGLSNDLSYTCSPPTGTPAFTSTLTIDASAATSEGSEAITVTGSSGKVSRTAKATLVVKKEDFTLTASPTVATVKKGQKASFTLDVNAIGGFNQPVTFTVSGLPSGANPTFSVPSAKPPFRSDMTIDVSTPTPVGNYTLTIEGAGGGKTRSVTVSLTVEKKMSTLEISVGRGLLGDVTVSGFLKPIVENAEVTLSYRGPEEKELTRKAGVDSDGAFKDTFSPDPPGNWTVTAKWPGNDEYDASASQTESFTSQKGINMETLLSFPYFMIPLVVAVVIVSTIAILIRRHRAKSRIAQPNVKTNTCSRCGTPVAPGDIFCPNCGSSINE